MDHLKKLKLNIEEYSSLNEKELSILTDSMELVKLDSYDYFLKEGEVCKAIGFVCSGILVHTRDTNLRNKYTINISFEGEWVSNYPSFTFQIPSDTNIRAIEPTEILVISEEKFSQIPLEENNIHQFFTIIMSVASQEIANMIIELKTKKPEQRINNLLCKHPDILSRVPHNHIADYLGMTKELFKQLIKGYLNGLDDFHPLHVGRND
jgi:CRP-like cAMP-binding protein